MNNSKDDTAFPESVDLEKHPVGETEPAKIDPLALYPTANPAKTYSDRPDDPSDPLSAWKNTAKTPPAKGKTVTVVLLIAAVFVAIATAAYWSFVRVPNAAYQQANVTIDGMLSDAKKMSEGPIQSSYLVTGDYTTKATEKAKKLALSYSDKLQEFKKSAAYNRDGDVRSVYDANKQKIEDYAVYAKNVIAAYDAVVVVLKNCESFTTSSWMGAKSAQEFDKQFKDCTAYLNAHPTIEPTALNDFFYTQYRSGLQEYITTMREYIVGDKTSGLTAGASSKLTESGQKMSAVAAKLQFSAKDDPTPALKRVRAAITQRANVTIR